MATLLYITCEYPEIHGDSDFIEREIEILSKQFSSIIVFSHGDKNNQLLRNIPNNVEIQFSKQLSMAKKILYLIICFFNKYFYKELYLIINEKSGILKKIKMATSFLISAVFDYSQLKRIYSHKKIDLSYSYWYWSFTLSICFLKKKYGIPCCTRTHGFDLYKFRNPCLYQPFKIIMNAFLDNIFFISKQGLEYYENNITSELTLKNTVSYLGINKLIEEEKNYTIIDRKVIKIVSCSYIVPLKRVNLIIDALSKVPNSIQVSWVHIGLGYDIGIIDYANKKLANKKNIKYNFLGNRTNSEILKYYSNNNIDLFVNMSETEGVPVSMMEALAYHIPICGTNVGGVNEIVNEELGFLMSKDNCVEEFVDFLNRYSNFSDERILKLRINAYDKWNKQFNADDNYKLFSSQLEKIITTL